MIGYWFTSSLFQVEAGEDEDINPGRYGRQLAVWLKKQLEDRGYAVEPIINEDLHTDIQIRARTRALPPK